MLKKIATILKELLLEFNALCGSGSWHNAHIILSIDRHWNEYKSLANANIIAKAMPDIKSFKINMLYILRKNLVPS